MKRFAIALAVSLTAGPALAELPPHEVMGESVAACLTRATLEAAFHEGVSEQEAEATLKKAGCIAIPAGTEVWVINDVSFDRWTLIKLDLMGQGYWTSSGFAVTREQYKKRH